MIYGNRQRVDGILLGDRDGIKRTSMLMLLVVATRLEDNGNRIVVATRMKEEGMSRAEQTPGLKEKSIDGDDLSWCPYRTESANKEEEEDESVSEKE